MGKRKYQGRTRYVLTNPAASISKEQFDEIERAQKITINEEARGHIVQEVSWLAVNCHWDDAKYIQQRDEDAAAWRPNLDSIMKIIERTIRIDDPEDATIFSRHIDDMRDYFDYELRGYGRNEDTRLRDVLLDLRPIFIEAGGKSCGVWKVPPGKRSALPESDKRSNVPQTGERQSKFIDFVWAIFTCVGITGSYQALCSRWEAIYRAENKAAAQRKAAKARRKSHASS